MPIWTVSFIDGVYQVADADGEHFPLTIDGNGLTELDPGWTPRGLQTGLPPLHMLELEHEDGDTALWFTDATLDYRGNGVANLSEADRQKFLATMTPLVREIFEQAVLPRIAAVPAAAHTFDEFLPTSVAEMLGDAVAQAVPRPRLIDGAAIRAGGSFGSGEVQLPAAWVETTLQEEMPPGGQDVLDLGSHRAWRRFHERFGATSYLLRGDDPADRHLYVPAAGVLFTETTAHDPVVPLILWYATHVDRAVPLPEIEALGLDLIRPNPVPREPEPALATTEPVAMGHSMPESALVESPVADAAPPAVASVLEPMQHPAVPTMTANRRADAPDPIAPAPAVPDVPGKQNWWKRLLGLGNP